MNELRPGPAEELEALRAERDTYRLRAEHLAGAMAQCDHTVADLRHALKQKREGFELLSKLQGSIGAQRQMAMVFEDTIEAINGVLGMDRSVVLACVGADLYRPSHWLGFAGGERLGGMRLNISDDWARSGKPLLVKAEATPGPLGHTLQAAFGLSSFVATSILVSGEVAGILISGRRAGDAAGHSIDEGDVDTFGALASLIAAFAHNRQVALLRQDNALLRHLATVDKLTGIANRARFEEVFHLEWKRALRRGTSLSAFMIDVDHFKRCNDTFGHDAGDAILRQIAERITGGLRPGDIGARYGGEEFVVLLPETLSEGAAAVAERVRLAIDSSPMLHGASAHNSCVTASIGVACVVPNTALDPASLITCADKALYQAKRSGRNRVVVAQQAGIDCT